MYHLAMDVPHNFCWIICPFDRVTAHYSHYIKCIIPMFYSIRKLCFAKIIYMNSFNNKIKGSFFIISENNSLLVWHMMQSFKC